MSKQSAALKLELEVDVQNAHEMDGLSRICNWLYNHLVEKGTQLKKEFIESGNKEAAMTLYSKRGLRNLLPAIKKENPFLNVVHSSPLKNTALRVSSAIQDYQKSRKGKRKGKPTGWPQFRSWKRGWFSLFYDEPTKGFKIQDKELVLSLGMGADKKKRSIRLGLPDADLLKGQIIRNLRIVCELGKYYAVFIVEKIIPKTKPISKVIALDPNHKNLAYGVSTDKQGIEIVAPKWLKVYDKRLDELKSKRDRCSKKSKRLPVVDEKGKPTGKEFTLPSRRWKKYDDIYKKTLRKRREQTKTFMFTTSHALFREYDCVAIGDYTPNGNGDNSIMRRAMNNRSVIGRWKEILSWVAVKSGKTFLEFDEKGTTRTCNCCHYVEPEGIPPNVRQWQCPGCQAIHIRDENAGINGLRKVLRDLSKKNEGEYPSIVSGSDRAFVQERWAWSVLPSGVLVTPRGHGSDVNHSSKKLKRGHASPRSKVDHLTILSHV
jgi:putative transposase